MSMMSAVSAGGENICGTEAGEIMLFGFRVIVDPIRKSVSLNDLSQYVQKQDLLNNINSEKDVPAGYVSADEAVHLNSSSFSATGNTAAPNNSNNRERKRGVPWTEDEHKLFLLGLQKVGKGDWRGISRNFVKTRTPTQVASHAQKYFLRRSNLNRRRRRSSLFDITTDTVASSPGTDRLISPAPSVQPIAPVPQESTAFYPGTISSANVLPSSPSNQNITAAVSQDSYRQSDAQSSNLMLPAIGKSVADFDLNENWLSLSMSSDRSNTGFTVGNRDGIINVA